MVDILRRANVFNMEAQRNTDQLGKAFLSFFNIEERANAPYKEFKEAFNDPQRLENYRPEDYNRYRAIQQLLNLI